MDKNFKLTFLIKEQIYHLEWEFERGNKSWLGMADEIELPRLILSEWKRIGPSPEDQNVINFSRE